MDIREEKQNIREKLLKKRSELKGGEYRSKSEQIIQRLKQQSEFQKASTVHCYVSINKRNEVNTHPLIKDLIRQNKKLAVPVTNFEDGTLSHIYLENYEDLKPNKWGVPEPERGEKANIEDFDLVIVPMVGGDPERNRIGYGKGFYDRFLRDIECLTLGLLFDCCLVESVPTETFDISLDKCITETKVIS